MEDTSAASCAIMDIPVAEGSAPDAASLDTACMAAIGAVLDTAFDTTAAPRPRAPRVRTLIHANLASEGKPGGEGIVRNVSPGGLCIASRSMTPAEGDLITVSLPGSASMLARVRWTREVEFGVLLTSQVNPLMARPVTPQRPAPFPAGAVRRWLSGWRDGFGKRTAFESETT